jgi:predicted AAA+ superfamily ATPase
MLCGPSKDQLEKVSIITDTFNMKQKRVYYNRNIYIPKIKAFSGIKLIKILVGMRRVGKSYILQGLEAELKQKSLFIDKDLFEFEEIRTAKDLVRKVKSDLKNGGTLFLDEVQEIENWEKAVVSFQKEGKYDIYLTGSNAHLLSTELATRLSGRFVEIPVYPLSFSEFIDFHKFKDKTTREIFAVYLKFGGLPGLGELDLKDSVVFPFLQGIYSTVILKDVVQKHQIRSVRTLENICRFVFDNIGQIFSSQKIFKYLKNQGYSIGVETVLEYVKYLEMAQIIHRVPRYDIKGKRLLEIHEKYFINDLGLRHALLGFRDGDINQLLENVVYLELKVRGYEVYIGKLGEYEIDFVAVRENKKVYIQVCYLLASAETVEREFSALEKINDNYEKTVLSMDETWGNDRNGINRIYLLDWLLTRQ